MTRPQAVSEQFRVVRQATEKATHELLVRTAKREHARVLGTDPRPTGFTRWVDGREGPPEESVKPAGIVVYRYRRLDIVGEAAVQVLIEKSPYGPEVGGHYRDRHQRFVNDTAVAVFENVPRGAVLMIGNNSPYARKIELGTMKMRVPGSDHVYQQAEQILSSRYSGMASIAFTYRDIGRVRSPVLLIREL